MPHPLGAGVWRLAAHGNAPHHGGRDQGRTSWRIRVGDPTRGASPSSDVWSQCGRGSRGISEVRSCLALMERHAAKMEAAGILPTTNAAAGKSGSSVLAAVGLTREDVRRLTAAVPLAKRLPPLAPQTVKESKVYLRHRMRMSCMPKYVPLLRSLRRWVLDGRPGCLNRILRAFEKTGVVSRMGARSTLNRIFGHRVPSVEEIDAALELIQEYQRSKKE